MHSSNFHIVMVIDLVIIMKVISSHIVSICATSICCCDLKKLKTNKGL